MEGVIDPFGPRGKLLSFSRAFILCFFVEALRLKERVLRNLNKTLSGEILRKGNIGILVAEGHVIVLRLRYFNFLDESGAWLLFLSLLIKCLILVLLVYCHRKSFRVHLFG